MRLFFFLCSFLFAIFTPPVRAQHPFEKIISLAAPSAGFTSPTSIGGMALYWNYNDLSQGATINGVAAHQPNSSLQPTNSASGLWFNSSRLTNLAFTVNALGAPFSLWVVYKPNGTAAGYHAIVCDHPGNNGVFNNANAGIVYFNVTGRQDMYAFAAGTSYDFLYRDSQALTNGAASGFTNGVATKTVTGANAPAWTINSIGSDNTSENFQGYIKFIGLWTNKVLTTSDAANLFTYSQAH
jgi:hypothetical protein